MKEFMVSIRSNRGKKNPQRRPNKRIELTTNEKFQIVVEAILALEDDIATLMKKVEDSE